MGGTLGDMEKFYCNEENELNNEVDNDAGSVKPKYACFYRKETEKKISRKDDNPWICINNLLSLNT